MRVEVTYVTVGCPVSRSGSPGCGRRIAEELRLAENARLRLALLGRCIVEGSPAAQARAELRKELRAIDAEWRSRISQEAALSLKRELEAIDAAWRPKILEEAQEKLAAAKALEEAAKLNELGGISTTSAPGTASIGVATDTAIAMGPSQQQSAGSAIASEELRNELKAINDRIELILKLRATDTQTAHEVCGACAAQQEIESGMLQLRQELEREERAAKVRKELRAELEAIDAKWKPVIELRKRLDEEFNAINGRIELILKSRATDAENQHDIITEAEKKLTRAAQALEDAANKLEKLGAMSTAPAPSTASIGVATDTTLAMGPSQQQAADVGSAIASEELRAELKAIDAIWQPVIELRKELRALDAKWWLAIELWHECRAIDGRMELSQELKAIDAEWHPKIILAARRTLRNELKAIDAQWKPAIVREELRKELEAIDAQWKRTIAYEARGALRQELKAIDAEWHPKIILAARRTLRNELKAIDARWKPVIELAQELKAIDAKWKPAIVHEAAKRACEELSRELKTIDAKWKNVAIYNQCKAQRKREECAAEARKELRAELEAIDAKWKSASKIKLEKASQSTGVSTDSTELALEFKATDKSGKMELVLKIKATDAEAQRAAIKAIEDGFVSYAADCRAATGELNVCDNMSTTSTPDTNLTSAVVNAVTTQRASSAL